jgi:hypothetical protein
MKISFLSILLLLFMLPGFCQSIRAKAIIFGAVIEPYNLGVIDYKTPTASQKGTILAIFPKTPKFMARDRMMIYRKLNVYGSLFQLYVLRDSVSLMDTAYVAAMNKDDGFYITYRLELKKDKRKLELWDRVDVLSEAMPIPTVFRFPRIGNERYDIDVLMLAHDWEMKTDIEKMDAYATSLAMFIYDAIIDRDVKHFRNIIIRTFDKTIIHEKSFDVNTYDLFKKFYH